MMYNIIQTIREEHNTNDAYFGLNYIEEQEEYACNLVANKSGLMLLAAHLIEISDKNYIKHHIPKELQLQTCDLVIRQIELLDKKRSEVEIVEPEFQQSFKDKIIGYFFGLTILLVLISIPVGIVTIIKWFI